MSELPRKENWGSRLGVVLAVAGSAVGLGNFLRFPGVAVDNGGGAFMVPYIISFLLLGIPIAWCEWTMGRLGGSYGQNSGPGVMYAIWRKAPAKGVGALALLIPVVIYMYYVVLEAWCLDYCIEFIEGIWDDGFMNLFAQASENASSHSEEVSGIVGASQNHYKLNFGLTDHGSLLALDEENGASSRMLWLVVGCFVVNFFIIYLGVTRGIETFCKWAMPALILCALIILVRVLTLPNINQGLGFMWNPKWDKLTDFNVWLAASGQIFFSLSVGFGLILCYSSYLRKDDDVVLTSLSASSTNEFCEVILGGLIVIPTAFLFLGAESASGQSTFGLGFVTVPSVMHFMPGGHFFGAMWFGLLFLAAVTSSLSMLQPAIAFLEDGFGLRRRSSVLVLAVVTLIGTAPTLYFSRDALAMDYTDFWCNFLMIVAATCQVLIFGWVIGLARGMSSMNHGADFRVPMIVGYLIKYITPAFLLIILIGWSWNEFPKRLDGMSPTTMSRQARRTVYESAIRSHFAADELPDEAIQLKIEELLGPKDSSLNPEEFPDWLGASQTEAAKKGRDAAADANIARFVFLGLLIFYLIIVMLADIACRNRIGKSLDAAQEQLE